MPKGTQRPPPESRDMIPPAFEDFWRRMIATYAQDFERHINGEFISNPGAISNPRPRTATEIAMMREQTELRGRPTAILDFGGFRAEIDMRSLNRGFQTGDRIRLPLYIREPVRYGERYGEHPQEDIRQIVLQFQHVGPTAIGSRSHPLFILEGIEGIGEESKSSDSKVLKLKPGAKRKIIL